MAFQQPQVIIAGAGPVGSVLALRLANAGVRCLVVERDTELQTDLRASTFHPPTLEMLDTLGLTSGLLERGLQTRTWQIRLHETHEKAEFDLDVISGDTPYPFRLQVEQRELVALAAAELQQHELAELRMGCELTSFTDTGHGVSVELAHADGETETLTADWLVAADGARSRIRGALDLEFDGLTYPETTILVTTQFPFQDHLPGLSNVNYVWHDEGTFSLLRLPGIWRCSVYAREGQTDEEAVHPDNIEAALQRVVPRDEPYAVEEIRPYRIHQRIVNQYRVGRVLLAGDAAHLNSPSGGMGMNGGIHDAFNLTDKLPQVLRGEADETLLDRYTRQRQPVAKEQILKQAHTNRTRMQQRDPVWRREELARLQSIAADKARSREYLLKSSMIEGLRRAEEIE